MDTKFTEIDADVPIERVRLLTRDMRPVKLVGTNSGVLEQVMHNRDGRRRMGSLYHSLLLIECELADTVMLLNADYIIVAHFMPSTETEKWAVREAQWAAQTAAWRRRDKDPQKQAEAQWHAAYANEILWLAITGHLKEPGDAVTFKQGDANWDWHHIGKGYDANVIATWNTYEPTFGLPPYENM